MGRRPRRLVLGALAAVLGVAALLPATLGSAADAAPPAATAHPDGDLATDLAAVDRTTAWSQLAALHLGFPTFHPEGLVVTKDRFYLSSTQIIAPTVAYPAPVGGYDRTPGTGIGHLFVIDRAGHLVQDVVLGQGDTYHPGGIDLHGTDLWVPVAQYRPNAPSEIDRIDIRTLRVTRQFTTRDHIGGIVFDASTGRLVGNNWGSRTFYEFTLSGRVTDTWKNPQALLDFQDCQYVPTGKAVCGGVTNLPQSPAAGGTAATYELGGLTLVDLRTHTVLDSIPFQRWSDGGHVMTRNPVKLSAAGNVLTLWAAPDNGEELTGTESYTWQATLPAR